MIGFLALLPRALTTFLYAVAALLRFYADTDTIPIQLFPLTILQWSFLAFALGQHLSWLISALSGTLEIEQRTREHEQRTKQIENEIEQIKKENERLAVLESKIEALFSKHGINLPLAEKPEQP